jgi:hypothetical protein
MWSNKEFGLGPLPDERERDASVSYRHVGAGRPIRLGGYPALNERLARGRSVMQRPSETEFVPVRVGQVEEAFAPAGIAWHRVRPNSILDDFGVQGINV